MKFYIKNFGCRLNQHEGDIIAERLLGSGFSRSSMRESDIIIINGCTVTSRADQKVRQFIHKAQRESGAARLIITGCTASAIEKKLLTPISGTETIPQRWRYNMSGYIANEKPMDTGDFPSISGRGITRVRAWLKIQDGCDRRCSYCIVPLVRGGSHSRSTNDVIAQTEALVDAGFCEIVLTGVDIGDWRDGDIRLPQLIEQILRKTEIHRLRLSSLEPPGLSTELIDIIANEMRIAPHLHIPLQSASDKVREAMKRPKYDIAHVVQAISDLRSKRRELCFGTDIIVGFPTESDADFAKTVDLLESGEISYTHLFRFSPRPGTEANNLEHLSPHSISHRMEILQRIDLKNRMNFAQAFIGQIMDGIVEKCSPNGIYGHIDNYLRFYASGDAKRGSIVKVLAIHADPMQIYGEVVSE